MLTLDHTIVPFSSFGSYMTWSVVPPEWKLPGLILRTMHGQGGGREAFRVELRHKHRVAPYDVAMTPALCRLTTPHGRAELCFEQPDVTRVSGARVGFELVALPGKSMNAVPLPDGSWQIIAGANNTCYRITSLRGTLSVAEQHEQRRDRPVRCVERVVAAPDTQGGWELRIEEFQSAPAGLPAPASFAQCRAASAARWDEWRAHVPAVPPRYARAAEYAWYVLWSATVRPAGLLQRPAMLMSKNWMTSVWSWDHCFNALALRHTRPELAWDQFMLLFDHQDAEGCLPDSVNADTRHFLFVKPPIHGWALRLLLQCPALRTPDHLDEIYYKLARWTEWWLRMRDTDDDGLPEYFHGNDSGWDNATVFDDGVPVASPDLAAYLIVQMDVLADIARRLRFGKNATHWAARAQELRTYLLARLWDGTRLLCRRAGASKPLPPKDCALPLLAIVAGTRLPPAVCTYLADQLRPDGPFVTAQGVASESPHSPLYIADGYWRGPVWGPTVVLAAEGLARAGYREHARAIARRYCEMCRRTMTFAENYDATTGAPLRDKAYSWGASAFLILAHEYL